MHATASGLLQETETLHLHANEAERGGKLSSEHTVSSIVSRPMQTPQTYNRHNTTSKANRTCTCV